jgi:hypothetical protein
MKYRDWSYKLHAFLISMLYGDECLALCCGRFTPADRPLVIAIVGLDAVKGKVKLSLCLTKYHAMKTY